MNLFPEGPSFEQQARDAAGQPDVVPMDGATALDILRAMKKHQDDMRRAVRGGSKNFWTEEEKLALEHFHLRRAEALELAIAAVELVQRENAVAAEFVRGLL